jgi:hypothetical protein
LPADRQQAEGTMPADARKACNIAQKDGAFAQQIEAQEIARLFNSFMPDQLPGLRKISSLEREECGCYMSRRTA